MAIARDLSLKLDAELVHFRSLMERETIETDREVIGFVFPLYDFACPSFIEKMIGKFTGLGSKYLFAVCSYGISAAAAMPRLAKSIQRAGGKLSGGFTVRMPHNGIGSAIINSRGRNERLFAEWGGKKERIVRFVKNRQNGVIEKSNRIMDMLFSGYLSKMLPTIYQLLKIAIPDRWDLLDYIADDRCDGCGICARICPLKNIEMKSGKKPVWSDHCVGCMTCLHWCPKAAIRLGMKQMNMEQYHHPETGLRDFLIEER